MTDVIEIISSSRGGHKLSLNGYTYNIEKKNGIDFRWICDKKYSNSCSARTTTLIQDNIHVVKIRPSIHHHDPDASSKHVHNANSNVRLTARNSLENPSQIILKSIVECNVASRKMLPNKSAQKLKIRRQRSNKIAEPTCLEDINIPQNLKFVEGELFLLSEKDFGESKILLFGTRKSLELLAGSDLWMMDGTFEVVPDMMRQLFTIFGRVHGVMVPLIFCVMNKKTRSAYDEFFYELMGLFCFHGLDPRPKYILSDFEKASVASAKSFLPDTIFKGCYFHFGQIIWRRVLTLHLKPKYASDFEFATKIRMLKCLAFVPSNEISSYYEEIRPTLCEDSKKIGAWLSKNYIRGPKNNKPQYETSFWSVYELLEEFLPRTQNNVEAWHRRLQFVLHKRSGLYALISGLQKEYINMMTSVQKAEAGILTKISPAEDRRESRIRKIIEERNARTKDSFLRGLAGNHILTKINNIK